MIAARAECALPLHTQVRMLVSSIDGAGEAPYLWREKIHAVLRFRVHGHTVAPKDFAGESWMRHFANEQADIDSLNGVSTIDPIIELKVLALFAAPTHTYAYNTIHSMIHRQRTTTS